MLRRLIGLRRNSTNGTREAFRAGFAQMIPTFPAVLAWSVVTGVAIAQSSLSLAQAYGLSILAYAGSAQLAALPLLVAHAPIWVIVLTALIVNLRFVIYSAALKPVLASVPLKRRLWYAYLIGDLSFVIFMRSGVRQVPAARPAYFLGAATANYLVWHLGSFAGLIGAGRIPARWGLDFAGSLALVALLVPMLASRPGVAGCLVAGALSVALEPLPAHSGLVAATLAGIVAALAVERLSRVRV